MKSFLLYCIILLMGCAHFTKERKKEVAVSSEQPIDSTQVLAKVSFKNDVQPILMARCQPCHFQGGVMHQKLPFDSASTIHELGEQLFTRITDDKEKALIQDFLNQSHE